MTSKPLDKETGLYNFPQRYYDCRNVKWLTLDPIGIELMVKRKGYVESLNWHNYFNINPKVYVDSQVFFTVQFRRGGTAVLSGKEKAKQEFLKKN